MIIYLRGDEDMIIAAIICYSSDIACGEWKGRQATQDRRSQQAVAGDPQEAGAQATSQAIDSRR